jgi:hypothetical protein
MSLHPRDLSGQQTEQSVWNELLYLSREEPARRYLEETYSQADPLHPKRAAFRNAEPFAAYIRQAESVFCSPLPHSPWLEPMLLYYGTMSLMKAWILSRRPEYPESTSVLRHGLSTRKRKKEPYSLFDDEVKVQKDGLFPLAARILGADGCIGDVYKVRDLAALIPDLRELYARLTGQTPLVPVYFEEGKAPHEEYGKGSLLLIEEAVLDRMKLTPSALARRIGREVQDGIRIFAAEPPVAGGWVRLTWHEPDGTGPSRSGSRFRHPGLYENERGDHYLWLGNDRPVTPVPELLSHLMLLFSLCMLCRYDPPLWGEIALGTIREEGVWTRRFLDLARRRIPNLILRELRAETD